MKIKMPQVKDLNHEKIKMPQVKDLNHEKENLAKQNEPLHVDLTVLSIFKKTVTFDHNLS